MLIYKKTPNYPLYSYLFYPLYSYLFYILYFNHFSLSNLKCLTNPTKLPDALRGLGQSTETTVSAWLHSHNNLL